MAEYNCKLKSLDVLLYDGIWYDPTSWGIAAFTGSWKVHAGFVVKAHGRTLVCDARASGIDVRPLSKDLKDKKKICVLRGPSRLEELYSTPFHNDVWKIWAGEAKYGFRKCGRNAIAEILGQLSDKEVAGIPDRAFCSEMVSAFLIKHGGFDPCPLFVNRYTTPADLYKKSVLKVVTERLAFG